jgi:hypothetical protein
VEHILAKQREGKDHKINICSYNEATMALRQEMAQSRLESSSRVR